jgi:uroporphyrinogen decarboxylase
MEYQQMNGRDRILTALEVRAPDRVPLYIHGINEESIISIGQHVTDGLPSPMQFHDMTEAERLKLVDALFLIHEEFGVDGFTAFEINQLEDLDTKHAKDDWGVVYARSPHGLPVVCGNPIQDAAALDRYTPPRPRREHLLLLDLARERFKGEKALFWMMRGTFVLSWRLAGMSNLMIQMHEDPGFVHRIAEMVTVFNLQMLELIVEAGVDVLVVEDDIADTRTTLISPRHFCEFVNPYNRRLVERAHELGLKVVRHSDGNLWKLLDTLLESGYDGLNPLEPQAGMTLDRVKAYCGDRLCLLGNIDCAELLPHGTPTEVDEAVQKAIEDGGKGGGLIICSSNSLHPDVDPENCIAMFRATHKYGAYNRS